MMWGFKRIKIIMIIRFCEFTISGVRKLEN